MTELTVDTACNIIGTLVTIALLPFAVFFYYEFKDLRKTQQELASEQGEIAKAIAGMKWMDEFKTEQTTKNHEFDKEITALKITIAKLS